MLLERARDGRASMKPKARGDPTHGRRTGIGMEACPRHGRHCIVAAGAGGQLIDVPTGHWGNQTCCGGMGLGAEGILKKKTGRASKGLAWMVMGFARKPGDWREFLEICRISGTVGRFFTGRGKHRMTILCPLVNIQTTLTPAGAAAGARVSGMLLPMRAL